MHQTLEQLDMSKEIDTSLSEQEVDVYEVSIVVAQNNSSDDTETNDSEDGLSPIEKHQPKTACSTDVINAVKVTLSGALLILCTALVTAAIFQKQTKATGYRGLHPAIAFCVFWVILLFLALIEGGLNCMVGLVPVNKNLYSETHPRAYACTKVIHRDGNMERFIVGRQYLDLLSIFTTNFMASSIAGAAVFGLPKILSSIFLESGLAVILVTIVFGQLVAQINAAHCMLDYINNYVMLAAAYLALAIEASGICHAVYFVQLVVERWAGKTSSRVEHTVLQKTLFWIRVVFSLCLLSFALIASFKALFDGDTTMWSAIPPYVSLLIFVCLVLLVGMLDALQIAFMAVVRMSPHKLQEFPVAKRNCDLVFNGKNLPSFLLGRQIFQTVIQFAIARIMTLDPKDGNIFGVSDVLQKVFNAGVLGALIATILASLCWRVLANSFPMAILSCPVCSPLVHFCLLAEGSGICSIAWVLARIHRRLAGFKTDDSYIGSLAKSDQTDDFASTDQGSDSEGNQSQHDGSV